MRKLAVSRLTSSPSLHHLHFITFTSPYAARTNGPVAAHITPQPALLHLTLTSSTSKNTQHQKSTRRPRQNNNKMLGNRLVIGLDYGTTYTGR